MGRLYATELTELPRTYRWALDTDVQPLIESLRRAASLPLIAIGSGGSLSVAEFAAALHRDMTGSSATAQTPLDTVASKVNLRHAAVLLISAGGSNRDILESFTCVARREPRSLIVVCLNPGSPLARRVSRFTFVDLVELSPPTRRDGFLATNSLIALTTLFERAYSLAFTERSRLPSTWEELLPRGTQADLDRRVKPAWEKQTLMVLYGPSTRVAAVDLESRFAEAALQDLFISDYRNFAHGRHNWLAKRPDSTAVLAFVTPDDREIASKTLSLFPDSVPTISLAVPFTGAAAGIAVLAQVMHITASAGAARNIDPGRPGVPRFGRQIYHLNVFRREVVPDRRSIAIERKAQKPIAALSRFGILDCWHRAYDSFISGLQQETFRGIVLDYDGTLCDTKGRFGSLETEVSRQLLRVVKHNIPIAIATGRGKSARHALREVFPKAYWDRVVVGYYNGGDIGLLSDARPDGAKVPGEELARVAIVLQQHRLFTRLARLECRIPQLTVAPRRAHEADDVWAIVDGIVQALLIPGISVLRSSHSIDVIGPGTDKRAVIRRLMELDGASDAPILCIGDKGRYPGNDFRLLSVPHALSVDEASGELETCWNIAPVGIRGVPACLHYLKGIRATPQGARVDERVWEERQ